MQHQSDSVPSLLYRVETMEKDITQLKTQLNLYEPATMSELKLQRITDTVGRIESELSKVKERLEAMNTHMVTQETEAQKRDAQQRENQDKLVIRVLWGALSIVITIVSLAIVAYYTHILH